MNLGKLLAAGKSIFGGRGEVAYRENKNVYLPKFGAAKNPFAPKPAPAAEVPAAPRRPVSPEAARADARPVARSAARSAGFTALTGRLNPFASKAVPAPAPAVSTVQTELSLDTVKVIHNDLADADIEVVPVRSRTVTPEGAAGSSARSNGVEFFSGQEMRAA